MVKYIKKINNENNLRMDWREYTNAENLRHNQSSTVVRNA
jgi:hypothetical protein